MFRRKAWGGKRLVSDLTCADKCDPKWGRDGGGASCPWVTDTSGALTQGYVL